MEKGSGEKAEGQRTKNIGRGSNSLEGESMQTNSPLAEYGR